MTDWKHAQGSTRVNELMIHSRVERAPRPGVVPAVEFGQALMRLLESEVRGEQLAFKSLEGFEPG